MRISIAIFQLWMTSLRLFFIPSFASAIIHNVSWTSYNPLFSGKDIPMLMENLKMNDRIRFICSPDADERTAIHRVDERAARECQIPKNFVDSLIGTCTKANDSVIIRLREIPMLPNEMSYKPNQDYFFITTSTGRDNGLENRKGGLCQTNNMRLKIRVESKSTAVHQEINNSPEIISKINSGPMVMIPVESGKYAVPVIYVPVAPSASANIANKNGSTYPYQLYLANGQLRAANLSRENSKSQTGVGSLPYPFKNLMPPVGSDVAARDGSWPFEAGNQPQNFGNGPSLANMDSYPTSIRLKSKDTDFEIEYVDSANDGSHRRTVFLIATISMLVF